MDRSFIPQNQQGRGRTPSPRQQSPRRTYVGWYQDQPWNGDSWGDGSHWNQESPRQRGTSPRLPAAPKPNKKSKKPKASKGDGKGKQNMKGKPQLEPPPWSSTTSTAAPTPAAPSAAQSKAEAKLLEIVAAMKKKDNLDPELQTLAQEAAQLQSQNATSKLMSAVSKHGDAKTALLEARQARANLHAVWKQYLDTAVQTWKGFLEDFDKEDKKLEDQITAAETGLSTAQENLDEAKQLATAQELREQVEEVIDDADMLDKTTRSGPAIREGLSEMLEGLQKLQAQTEEVAVEKAEDRKRQRLEDGSGKPSSVPPAMQPFGKADR